MKVKTYSIDEIHNLFEFDDETGVYYLEGDNISVTINSWNYLMNIYPNNVSQLSKEDIFILYKIFKTLYFNEENFDIEKKEIKKWI